MGKQQKPKPVTTKVDESRRANGKLPKQNPKTNKRKPNGSIAGYSAAAAARREQRRAAVTLAGLRSDARGLRGQGGTLAGLEDLTA